MRTKIIIALVLILVAATSVISYRYLQSQTYHPVVQLTLPDGLSITAVLPDANEAKACMTANERFVAPFTQQCKQCKVAAMRCYRELVGLEQAMRQGLPVAHPIVVARDLRMAIMGPPEAAKAGCQILAADIAKKGVPSAACILPQQPS